MNRKTSFILGMRDSTPVGIAFLFLFFSIGTLCHLHGFSLLQASTLSSSVFAAPLQIILLEDPYRKLNVIIALSFIINFRLLMMGFTLKRFFQKISGLKLWISALLLCTSTFIVSHTKFKQNSKGVDCFAYFLGVALPSYFIAIMSTILGYLMMLEWRSTYLLDLLTMILPIHFAGLNARHWPDLKALTAICAGFVLMPFFYQWLPNTGELFLPLSAGSLMVLHEVITKQLGKARWKSG